MNILTNYPNVSLVTTNPATDSVVRDSAVRPIIPPASPLPSSNASPSVASERDKAQPAQVTPSTNPTYDLPANQIQDDIEQPQDQEGQSQEQDQQDQEEQQQQGESDQPSDESNERYSEQEQAALSELQLRDREVVAHEQAHSGVGGKYAGAPSYSYERGPDGTKYAVSGEVSIDTSKVANDPHATLVKAQQIKRAALAPAQPSSQDLSVAASADQMAAQARQEIMAEQSGDGTEKTYRIDGEIKSDSFNQRIELAQDGEFQQTLKNRTLHINQYYQSSSRISDTSTFSQQV